MHQRRFQRCRTTARDPGGGLGAGTCPNVRRKATQLVTVYLLARQDG